MAITLEIDVFTGRPNPVIELDEDLSRSLSERLRPTTRLDAGITPPEPSFLGYRGFIVEGADRYNDGLPRRLRLRSGTVTGVGLAHHIEDRDAQSYLTSSDGPLTEVGFDLERLRQLIDQASDLIDWPWWDWYPWPWTNPCSCAPIYEPNWWNVPARQPVNNCYNYASNYRTDTFAQPGQRRRRSRVHGAYLR